MHCLGVTLRRASVERIKCNLYVGRYLDSEKRERNCHEYFEIRRPLMFEISFANVESLDYSRAGICNFGPTSL